MWSTLCMAIMSVKSKFTYNAGIHNVCGFVALIVVAIVVVLALAANVVAVALAVVTGVVAGVVVPP